ncbi:hypothetical protein H257_10322 [Aphanomyces astaci]|uniref:Uncharacterized protein n=1 Tax=Aphanomyces astaci TaxID=112090 RepID=W4G743_APHAT|nr:hypothetical protein H257_10322 [Aphanomyces astaci]ETV75490.1 hypothetical protein H257_10322 [Aphanomyces astaci]|eukprot:XP_009835124.1 hypothetical protein H257_10322 [Aphanomyces astaci]
MVAEPKSFIQPLAHWWGMHGTSKNVLGHRDGRKHQRFVLNCIALVYTIMLFEIHRQRAHPVDPAIGAVCTPPPPSSPCSAIKLNVDFPGYDLTNIPSSTPPRSL